MPAFHAAPAPQSAFLNALLHYTDGEGWEVPIHVGDWLEVADRHLDRVRVVALDEAGRAIVEETPGGARVVIEEDDYPMILESPHAAGLWETVQRGGAPDGVAWGDGLVPADLRGRLLAGFDRLCAALPVDWHPGAEGRVRDLLHPSLYHRVAGVSLGVDGRPVPPTPEGTPPKVDRWGRPFEGSRHQWLPVEVDVDGTGGVRFVSPFHDHDPGPVGELRADLEALLACALPLLESVAGYAAVYRPWDHAADDCEADLPHPPAQRPPAGPVSPVSLRGRRLQIIPKLVQYELAGDATQDSVWHVEGMSHEHILGTVVCVLDRDENLEGGTLRFRRGYTREDAGQVFWNINQIRPGNVDEMVSRGVLPLGSLPTPAGRLLAFPNAHIHRLTPLRSSDGARATRRIAVFWLVDPDHRIPSTADVPPQRGRMAHADALAHRIALMEERRRQKQSHNLREVSLCEH